MALPGEWIKTTAILYGGGVEGENAIPSHRSNRQRVPAEEAYEEAGAQTQIVSSRMMELAAARERLRENHADSAR